MDGKSVERIAAFFQRKRSLKLEYVSLEAGGLMLGQFKLQVEDGRITIPEELRELLNWQPGDNLQFVLEGDQIVVYKLHLALVR